jgi:hypothetical protein
MPARRFHAAIVVADARVDGDAALPTGDRRRSGDVVGAPVAVVSAVVGRMSELATHPIVRGVHSAAHEFVFRESACGS